MTGTAALTFQATLIRGMEPRCDMERRDIRGERGAISGERDAMSRCGTDRGRLVEDGYEDRNSETAAAEGSKETSMLSIHYRLK